MSKYIKSHSNYRLSSRHQITNQGTILESDISTLGGVNSFATGQSTIYSSGNFVMTINNERSASRHIIKKGWEPNSESGNTWNAEVLQNYTSDINGSVEQLISIKNDFLDLRSFACYGSLYDLIENSVNGILVNFPYEVYTGTGNFDFKRHKLVAKIDGSHFDYSGNVKTNTSSYEATASFLEINGSGTPVTHIDYWNGDLYEIDNPGGIDMHTKYLEDDLGYPPLKYFANGGYLNYGLFDDSLSDTPEDGYNFSWDVVDNSMHVGVLEIDGSKLILRTPTIHNFCLKFTQRAQNINSIFWNDKSYDLADGPTSFLNGTTVYGRIVDEKIYFENVYCPRPNDYIATVSLFGTNEKTVKLYAFRDDNLNVVYYTTADSLFTHIRPKSSIGAYDDFIDGLNMFQKCLLGIYSGKRNEARFEILEEVDGFTKKKTQIFKFPIGKGDYNIGGSNDALMQYIQNLGRIGLVYDESYTDNMYRVMTHESLKNFDWTRNFNGNDNEYNNEYTESSEKFKAIVRVMGYVFDQEKAYIDAIGNTNIVTYNNRDNVADYFISDLLDVDGWDIVNISTYILHEYDRETGDEVNPLNWSEINQKNNIFLRQFHENNQEIIAPYAYDEGGFYSGCLSGSPAMLPVPDGVQTQYYVEDGVVKPIVRDYHSNDEYTVPDVNNAFMKRLKLNSRYLLRKKGTVEGVESMLALFGMKSRRWFDKMGTSFEKKYSNYTKKLPFDYEIIEYTAFAPPIKEEWEANASMYKIDYYNSCKTVPYDTESYMNGIYIPYQGLPVAYRDLDTYLAFKDGEYVDVDSSTDTDVVYNNDFEPVHARRLYPNFESKGIYDGDMYYQMNGGWLSFWPYFFDNDSDLGSNYDNQAHKETLRNVKQVKDIEELLSQPAKTLNFNSIYYVHDINKNYAIIDGHIYPLINEATNDSTLNYYFNVKVYNGGVQIGDKLYLNHLKVSNPYGTDGIVEYDLNVMDNESFIPIYYTPDSDYAFTIHGFDYIEYYRLVDNGGGNVVEESCDKDTYGAQPRYINEIRPDSTMIFKDGSYYEAYKEYTHYFKLSNQYMSNLLAYDGWSQLSKTDPEYLRMHSVIDKFNGNNPHSGGFAYDNGYEYMSRFSSLFKYAYNNDLFNDECFLNKNESYDFIKNVGFSGLTASYDDMKDYTPYLNADKKIHSFVDLLNTDGTISAYDINSRDRLSGITAYSKSMEKYPSADGVTSQIINTKVVDIRFFLQSDDYFSKECQEEVKYIQDKVMPYVEQMLSSTLIAKVKFFIQPFNWVFDTSTDSPEGEWHDYYYWQEDGQWING